MPVDELRHSLSDASAAVEALSRRLQGRLVPGERELVDHVRITMRRFEEVMDALIAYERATEPIELEAVDLNDLMATAIAFHADELRPGDEVDIAHLPTVPGDKALLLAMFRPLVENAIKYRHPGRALRIDVRPERVDHAVWRLVVEDNGIGIDPDNAEHVFEMFERGDPNRLPGQGLGLAAARRIAEAHGGMISAEPQQQGTAIHVLLPGLPDPRPGRPGRSSPRG